MKTKMLVGISFATRVGLIPLICLTAGCGTPKEKPLLTRGWTGGQVTMVRSFPKTLIPRPKAAVLVTALVTNTPAAVAGVRAGDLILALNHQPVEKLRDYRRRIDAFKPGTSLPITVFRDGQIQDFTMTVGRENYREGGAFTIFFPGIARPWDLWPRGEHPGFSLVALGYQKNNVDRTELGSVESQYHLSLNAKDYPYNENYKIWLGVMEFSDGKHIVSQQMADAAE